VIARLEGSRVKPSTRALERFARAIGTWRRITFERDIRRCSPALGNSSQQKSV